MSIENNVKGTTNKLIEKYSKGTWDYLFNLIFSSEAWTKGLTKLMTDKIQNKVDFVPKFNNIFRSFDLCPLDKVKVVVVAPYPSQENTDGLAFSGGKPNPFTRHINNITNSPLDGTALEYLPGQEGVMLLNASITAPVGNPTGHVEMWEPIISQMIDQICYRTMKTIFVFIGEETEHLAKNVRKGHYKFFLPTWENDEDGWDPAKFFDNVNDLLKKIDREPINW